MSFIADIFKDQATKAAFFGLKSACETVEKSLTIDNINTLLTLLSAVQPQLKPEIDQLKEYLSNESSSINLQKIQDRITRFKSEIDGFQSTDDAIKAGVPFTQDIMAIVKDSATSAATSAVASAVPSFGGKKLNLSSTGKKVDIMVKGKKITRVIHVTKTGAKYVKCDGAYKLLSKCKKA